MEQHTLNTRLTKVQNKLTTLGNTLYKLKITDMINHSQLYEEFCLDAVSNAEQIACSLRYLIYAGARTTDNTTKIALMKQVANNQEIKVQHTSDMVEIMLPLLLPKKTKHYTNFLTDPLYYKLMEYQKEEEIPRFKECVVCFSHIFEELSLKKIHDYDNLECKQILDTMATFFMIDDSGFYCDIFHTTEIGKRNSTILTIMKKNYFPEWLSSKKQCQERVSDF